MGRQTSCPTLPWAVVLLPQCLSLNRGKNSKCYLQLLLFQIKLVEILLTAISLETFTFQFQEGHGKGRGGAAGQTGNQSRYFQRLGLWLKRGYLRHHQGFRTLLIISLLVECSIKQSNQILCSGIILYLSLCRTKSIIFAPSTRRTRKAFARAITVTRREPPAFWRRPSNEFPSKLSRKRSPPWILRDTFSRGSVSYAALIHVYVIHLTDFGLNFKI